MKYSATLASALTASALMAPSVMATAANSTEPAALPIPSVEKLKEMHAGHPKDFVHAAITGLSLRQNQSTIDAIDCDLYSFDKYGNVPSADLVQVHTGLLCELVKPNSVVFNNNAIQNQNDFNDILLRASLVGQDKNSTSPLHSMLDKKEKNDKEKEDAKKTKEYLDRFCRSLTYSRNQFLIANSSSLLQPASASQTDQNKVVMTVLELCKAHLGDARTLAASVGATVAATAFFLTAFL